MASIHWLLLLPLLFGPLDTAPGEGELVWRQELSSSVQAACLLWDVDGAGLPDVALGQPGWRSLGGRGRVVLISSETGEVLEILAATRRRRAFGASLALQPASDEQPARLGVSFESGSADQAALGLALLGPGEDDARALVEHAVLASHGQLTTRLRPKRSQTLLSAGDLNADGVGDWLLGAPAHPVAGAAWASGRVIAFNGAGGRRLWERSASEGEVGFGSALALLPDSDADGVPEVLVGSPGTGSGRMVLGSVHLLSGVDGEGLDRTLGSRVGQALGRELQACAAGALVGATGPSGNDSEYWYWERGEEPRRVLRLGGAEPGDEPRLWRHEDLLLLAAAEDARASLWVRPLHEVLAGAELGTACLPRVTPVAGESESVGPVLLLPHGAGLRVVATRLDGAGESLVAAWDVARP